MNDILFMLLLSLIPATFGKLLDYALGEPGSDQPKTKQIFSSYSLWLAKQRVGPGKLHEIREGFFEMLRSSDPETRQDAQDQMDLTIMMEAKKRFGYEKGIGMCIFCTNVWLSLIFAGIFCFAFPPSHIDPIWYFLTMPIFSHSILRKL